MRCASHTAAAAILVSVAIAMGDGCAGKPEADVEATTMQAGLDALYVRHDAEAATAEFRKVLERNPTHYGATFQLAAALEAAGRRDEARPWWEKMLALAESHQDEKTLSAVREHLGPSTVSEDAMMQAGLDALYNRHDPADAVARFRAVLERNPTHYGATFQLAAALDAAGKHDEARPVWEKMVRMAEAVQDTENAERARSRLKGSP